MLRILILALIIYLLRTGREARWQLYATRSYVSCLAPNLWSWHFSPGVTLRAPAIITLDLEVALSLVLSRVARSAAKKGVTLRFQDSKGQMLYRAPSSPS